MLTYATGIDAAKLDWYIASIRRICGLTGIATGSWNIRSLGLILHGQGTPAIRSSANVQFNYRQCKLKLYNWNFTTSLALVQIIVHSVSMTASSAAFTRGYGIVNLGYYNTNSLNNILDFL